MEVSEKITELCREPMIFEKILKKLFDDFGLKMNFEQYVLVGSTVRSYLAWLKELLRVQARTFQPAFFQRLQGFSDTPRRRK